MLYLIGVVFLLIVNIAIIWLYRHGHGTISRKEKKAPKVISSK